MDWVILSGIHAYYEPEELVGKTLLAITNLPPRPMMGIESCGMLISAVHHEEGEEKLHLLMLDNHCACRRGKDVLIQPTREAPSPSFCLWKSLCFRLVKAEAFCHYVDSRSRMHGELQ